MRRRVAIFIDGASLFYAALQLEIEVDYTKLLRYLAADSRLLRSFFYTGVDRSNERQQASCCGCVTIVIASLLKI